ncbi:MAG TPA: hypothetical protein VGF91_13905 [Solirubrobacteraceae bacterium]
MPTVVLVQSPGQHMVLGGQFWTQVLLPLSQMSPKQSSLLQHCPPQQTSPGPQHCQPSLVSQHVSLDAQHVGIPPSPKPPWQHCGFSLLQQISWAQQCSR